MQLSYMCTKQTVKDGSKSMMSSNANLQGVHSYLKCQEKNGDNIEPILRAYGADFLSCRYLSDVVVSI